MEIGVPLIIIAVVLFVVGVLLRRQRPDKKAILEGAPAAPSRRRGRPEPEPELDFVHPRPSVVDMHVRGNEARVTFDVPIPDEPDEVLAELLVAEAVEVIREKRHSLPMSDVTEVIALAGTPDRSREVGRASLETAGQLPPLSAAPSMLNLTTIATDPLERSFHEKEPDVIPETVVRQRTDTLRPIGADLRLPKAVDTGLRAQGVDPSTMSSAQLVTGMLSLVGYNVEQGIADNVSFASKAGSRTFIREDPYREGDHPEVDEATIQRFLFEFQSSGCERGLFVSDKFSPYSIYDKERREPRIRFVTRERLQKFVDALSLG